MARNQDIINRVRRDFEIGLDTSDDEIWEGVENTFIAAAYALDMAKQDVKKAVLDLCYENKITRKIIKKLQREFHKIAMRS